MTASTTPKTAKAPGLTRGSGARGGRAIAAIQRATFTGMCRTSAGSTANLAGLRSVGGAALLFVLMPLLMRNARRP